MKEKNDLKPKNAPPEMIQPHHCVYCNHQIVEEIQFVPNGSHCVRRVAKKGLFRYFWPELHDLYAWRCMNCGYLMLFTARDLD